ncbi:MAG TPA: UDP-N-acetylglucosamine 2-epimerase (non-hydrolyzing) [Candidatus Obscuribacter sp.]|nr:UDP-N-acetylglucosamine 2-epimerase (non-hydrolyzing) [Candidatus Obscuribacter sp.]HNB15414.1 UDP-N-acetylglucosamine 2-epimerase (non-hydrolyzing) [Candidatus Obscuribacter sp.]HND08012.1 UDP-N-acetylglucosamine 2-epimerase (non-hydrolyzing) [Candidatus Obscuribacter sp.]HND67910.1 UDP-N-acetylglucosamine 2-epimerase (non-hydrolyzing) [Candidatus Obscuribacter sp.]HNG73124.1 UDP-N-acetylglucosamine 2-epimerase (non-hydrolyzing) [Candidatus Obscuribacter sp.]
MKKRVMCVFGTRPEAVKLAPVVHALKESAELEPVVAITAQHREMLDQMMKWFDVKADYDLDLMKHGQTLAELTSRVVLGMDDLLSRDRPDMLLVQGDTVTVMAASLAAFYHKIPVGHVEAGLRTNDRYNPFPEEMSRRQTGRIATMHFAPTDLAVKNLAAEGITENVFMTGNTVIDALLDTAGRLSEETIDKQLFGAADFDRYKVLLVTAHRRENWGQGMDEIALALRHIAEEFPDVQVLYPIHRNPVVRQSIEPVFAGHDRLLLVEPLDYVPFVYAMRRCHFILTDSGGVQEEAPALGKPVLVMRTNTERPEAVSAGAAQLVGVSQETICDGARQLMTSPQRYKAMSSAVNPFGDGQAAKRIVQEVEKFLRSP